jgi:hypothetical protein
LLDASKVSTDLTRRFLSAAGLADRSQETRQPLPAARAREGTVVGIIASELAC